MNDWVTSQGPIFVVLMMLLGALGWFGKWMITKGFPVLIKTLQGVSDSVARADNLQQIRHEEIKLSMDKLERTVSESTARLEAVVQALEERS